MIFTTGTSMKVAILGLSWVSNGLEGLFSLSSSGAPSRPNLRKLEAIPQGIKSRVS